MTTFSKKDMMQYATTAYNLFRDAGSPLDPSARKGYTKEELAFDVARVVGARAAREGWSPEQLKQFLQVAYGKVWVILGSLAPGADLKDISRVSLKAFEKTKATIS